MYVSWPTISIKKRQSKSGTQSLSWCDEGANGIPWQIASFTFLFENSQAWIGQKSDLIGLICLHATRLAIPPDIGFQHQSDIFFHMKISIGTFFYPIPPIRSFAEQFLELLLLITENPPPPRLHFSFIGKSIFFCYCSFLALELYYSSEYNSY